MLPEGFRRKLMRRARFESFEQRLALSANPLSDFAIEHHTNVVSPVGMDGLPSLSHHVSEIAPAVPELHVSDGVQGDFILEKVSAVAGSEIEQQLNDVHDITGVNHVHNNYGFTGSNQTVVIIDSGIAYDHYNLGGGFGANNRVVGGWDFAENDADPYDDAPSGFHGTHVAGIVGSDHSTYRGVADEVDLVALRVFNDQGDGVFSWVEQALDWVHDHRNDFEHDITTVNLSLGSTWNSDSIPTWASLEDEFAQLEADGIFISVSAGNSFASYNTPGLSYPAASPYVVPVASITNGGIFSSFSQRHDRALAEPGSSIGSTVPDFIFGADGIPNDFGVASGTSMAAPYVAGASVLVREAMEFVGTQNITQDMIYDHLRDTADVFFDSATNANYRSINVGQAIDQLMPDDDFGSSVNAAHSLGTLNDGSTFSGLIGRVDDFDYFTFTAGASGSLSLGTTATHNLALNASGDGATFTNGQLTMDVVSGQSYTVSLGTSDGIGYYDVTAALEATATDLGTVDFEEHNDQSFDGSESYDFAATRTGIFTIEALFESGNGNIDLQLLDGNGNELGSSTNGVNAERIDANVVAGQSYTVVVSGTNSNVDFRLANLVSADNGTFTVFGTDGDDTLISDARDLSISINGIVYLAAAGEPITDAVLSADLGGGNDTAVLEGTSGNEVAVVSRGNTTATGSTNSGSLTVTVLNAENVQLNGHGGSDSVTFNDTDGDDRFDGSAANSLMTGFGYSHSASDFATVIANASSGHDVAFLNDTDGDDRFYGRHDSAKMEGDGYSITANNFDQAYGYATSGFDVAQMWDSDGNDVLDAREEYALLKGAGYRNFAGNFDQTYAYASTGFDIAKLRDSAGNDVLDAGEEYALLKGAGYRNFAGNFDQTYAYSSSGFDIAKLRDSAGNDVLDAGEDYAVLKGSGYRNFAGNFDQTYSYATGGFDIAKLRDSAGNDVLDAGENYAVLKGSGYRNFAGNFDQTYAYATSGFDVATLRDSVGNDVLDAGEDYAVLKGSGYRNFAGNFDQTYAHATAGFDIAKLRDSAGNDVLNAGEDYAILKGSGYRNFAGNFDQTYAYATSGFDIAELHDSIGNDTFNAGEDYAVLNGSGFRNFAGNFDQTYAYATGGFDIATLYDSADNDVLDAREGYTLLKGGGFRNFAGNFDQTYAYASTGFDVAKLRDSAGNDTFDAGEDYALLKGGGFRNYAGNFDQTYAYASSGYDVAKLRDSVGNDTLNAGENYAVLKGSAFRNYAQDFDQFQSFSTNGGFDSATFSDSAGNDLFTANTSSNTMSGSNYFHFADQFESVLARSINGGNDLAKFNAVDSSDTLVGLNDEALLTRDSLVNRVQGFDSVQGVALNGETPTADIGVVDYLFEQFGVWL